MLTLEMISMILKRSVHWMISLITFEKLLWTATCLQTSMAKTMMAKTTFFRTTAFEMLRSLLQARHSSLH